MAKIEMIELPALPTGQTYVAILDKPFAEFCKYSGDVNKQYDAPLDSLNADSIWKLADQGYRRVMGTVTIPQEGYPAGETRLGHCDARHAAILDNTYGYGSGGGGGGSADWKTKYLREAVLGVVMANMLEYKGRKVDAVKAVAEDHESMFLACCVIREKNNPEFGPAQEQFDAFWPKQVANADKRVAEKKAADKAAANAFDLGDFALTS